VNLVPSVMLSSSGVVLAAVAFYRRDDPAWRRGMVWIMGLAIVQVVLGVVSGPA
jgi:hypothetical protein